MFSNRRTFLSSAVAAALALGAEARASAGDLVEALNPFKDEKLPSLGITNGRVNFSGGSGHHKHPRFPRGFNGHKLAGSKLSRRVSRSHNHRGW